MYSLFLVCCGELDEIIGIVCVKELLVVLEEGVDVVVIVLVFLVIIVLEIFDLINLLGVLCCVCGSFVIVINEFGVV